MRLTSTGRTSPVGYLNGEDGISQFGLLVTSGPTYHSRSRREELLFPKSEISNVVPLLKENTACL